MITRSPGQHVFTALGTPWIDAVVAFLEPRARVDPWIMHGKMAIGDLVITVLDTTPRTVLCIETVAAPFDGTSRMEVDEEVSALRSLPVVPNSNNDGPSLFPRIQGRSTTHWPTGFSRPSSHTKCPTSATSTHRIRRPRLPTPER